MSEDNKAKDVCNKLIREYNFSKDLLKFKPNSEDIKNKAIKKAFSTASKTKKGKGKNPGKVKKARVNQK